MRRYCSMCGVVGEDVCYPAPDSQEKAIVKRVGRSTFRTAFADEPNTDFNPPQPTPDQVREIVAKWLFGGRDSLRRPQFYADWYHETDASPYTKLGYMDSADELLSALRAAGALREGL